MTAPHTAESGRAVLTINVDAEAVARVESAAEAEGKSVNQFLKDLLNEGWFKRYDRAPVVNVFNAGDWQPIETAPRDGALVILAPNMVIGWWEFGDEQWMISTVPLNSNGTIQADWADEIKLFYCVYANAWGIEPTHWLPCPQFISQAIEAGTGETEGLDPKDESAVGTADAPAPSAPSPVGQEGSE